MYCMYGDTIVLLFVAPDAGRSKYAVPLLLGGTAVAAGAGYALYNAEHIKQALREPTLTVSAAEKAKYQESVS